VPAQDEKKRPREVQAPIFKTLAPAGPQAFNHSIVYDPYENWAAAEIAASGWRLGHEGASGRE